MIHENPIEFDVSRCVTEVLHITDPELLFTLSEKILKKLPLNANLASLAWFVHADGETQQYPFALLKVAKCAQYSETLSIEEARKLKHELEP